MSTSTFVVSRSTQKQSYDFKATPCTVLVDSTGLKTTFNWRWDAFSRPGVFMPQVCVFTEWWQRLLRRKKCAHQVTVHTQLPSRVPEMWPFSHRTTTVMAQLTPHGQADPWSLWQRGYWSCLVRSGRIPGGYVNALKLCAGMLAVIYYTCQQLQQHISTH